MSRSIWHALAALLAACVGFGAQAQPIADPGTEGFLVIATGGAVVARYEGTSASYSNDLYLGDQLIFNNQSTPVGTTFDLGSFAAGTELMFRLHVNNTGYDFFTGPASRNPDGAAHARVQSDWSEPGRTLVSFEDLYGGPYDFNDLSFSFTNTTGQPAPVPEPAPAALLLAGLGLLGALRRR